MSVDMMGKNSRLPSPVVIVVDTVQYGETPTAVAREWFENGINSVTRECQLCDGDGKYVG